MPRKSAANDNTPIATASGIRFLSVCSGIEAASVAFGPLGWEAVAFSEIEKFPSAVLAHHYPDVPNLGDFTTIDIAKLGRVDILCGGTPCQAFSVAGARGGLNDARGNLTLAFVELAHALADGNGLRNAVWENVPGVFSDKTNAFGCFLAGLVGADDPLQPPAGRTWPDAGMVAGPKGRAAWCVLDAQHFGLAQRRRRVIVVADFGNGADPAAVLFERKSMFGYSPTRREAGQGVAGATADCFSASSIGTYRRADVSGADRAAGGDNGGGSENLVAYAPEIARCVATREGSSQDFETTTMVAVQTLDGSDVARTLSARHDGSPCVDRGPDAVVCFSAKDYSADAQFDLSPTLRAGGHSGSHANAGVMPAVTVALRGREGGATAELGGEVATALRSSQGGGDKPHVLTSGAITTSAVRRLTPIECERLQGFPEVRKSLYIQAWKHHSSGLQKNSANVETANPKSQKYASNADASESTFNVPNAESLSSAGHLGCEKHADVHALINFEQNDLQLRSRANSSWSANIAEPQNSSLLCMPIDDFVRLVAHLFTIQEKITQAGRAGLQTNTMHSSLPQSGRSHKVSFGHESGAGASDATLFMKELDAFMRSITSKAGHEIDTLEQTLQTSLCFATNAISSCIPETMLRENSFSLTIEGVRGYTDIPWRGKPNSPDGPRYKALGNSWAVPKFRWIGERITRLLAANDNHQSLPRRRKVSHA